MDDMVSKGNLTELSETVDYMTSSNYTDRFKAEYYQLTIRLNKLKNLIEGYKSGYLPFEPTCPLNLLEAQYNAMLSYQSILITRAELEGIKL